MKQNRHMISLGLLQHREDYVIYLFQYDKIKSRFGKWDHVNSLLIIKIISQMT